MNFLNQQRRIAGVVQKVGVAVVMMAIGVHGAQADDTEASPASKGSVPHVDVHNRIERLPLLKTGDAYENANFKGKLYNFRNHAPWIKSVDSDYQHASAEAVERYRDMKFGVRIHFGLYQRYVKSGDGRASWVTFYTNRINGKYNMEEDECKDFIKDYYSSWEEFNPSQFDGERWGALFKETGFKFAVLTTKHHDGFSMFHTKTQVPCLKRIVREGKREYGSVVKHFSIEDTPYQKDLVKQYVNGLRKHNLAVGLYFSNPDWWDYDARFAVGNVFRDPAYRHKSHPEGFARFARRYRQQLVELCSQYGKIDILSFDHGLPHELWPQMKESVKTVRKLQPDVMMRHRGIGPYGDFYTPEGNMRHRQQSSRPWSVIGVSGNTAPAQSIIHKLLHCVSAGGNFQWNCNPELNGAFSPQLIEKMKQVGSWMKLNGEAIYATRPWKQTRQLDADATIYFTRSKDEKTLYGILPKWPGQGQTVTIQSLSSRESPRHKVASVYLLGHKGELSTTRDDEGLHVTLPTQPSGSKYAWSLKIILERIPNFGCRGGGPDKVPVPEYRWASEQAYDQLLDMKYGIRIHWGIYSTKHLRASWPLVRTMTNQQRTEYFKLRDQFDPKYFDADQWMQWFKDNGMNMFAFTTKHHDGFSMFDTKTRVKSTIDWNAKGGPKIKAVDESFSVMESPYKRDIVKELCDSAHKHRLKINLYYSHTDWYDADQRKMASTYPGLTIRPSKYFGETVTGLSKPTASETKRAMQRHRQQLKELLTNYGPIDMICLDSRLRGVSSDLRQTILELRKLQPDVMFRDRGIGTYGDYFTPERCVPGDKQKSNMPWFVIYPLGGYFSYQPKGEVYQSGDWIIHNVVDSVSKGGNFMVAVGPDGNGRFHPKAVEAIEDAGAWLRVNGEAIYATRSWKHFGEGPTAESKASANSRDQKIKEYYKEHRLPTIPYTADDIRFTRSKDYKTLYAILMDWPKEGKAVTIKSLADEVSPDMKIGKVSLLGYEGELKWSRDAAGLRVILPAEKPCDYAYALKIEKV